MKRAIGSLLILLTLWSCQEQEQKRFQLLSSEQTGIEFTNSLTPSAEFNILEYLYYYNGGGVSAGDINNDGLVDLYFTANQASNKLYLNKGNLKFEDITAKAGVSGSGTWSAGTTMADVNGDGWLDIYVSNVGNYKSAQGKNELFINNQDGSFTESASAYGLDFEGFSTQAAFFDYDKDGDLDMYLLTHAVKNPEVFSESSTRNEAYAGGDRMYQSQLAQGKNQFMDVTEASGIYSSIIGFGLGITVSDVNQDQWPDIYISNDFTENDYLYINNQDGTFSERLEESIRHTSRYSMGNEIADLNNDGFPEIITTDMLPSDPEIWRKSVTEDKVEVYKIKERLGYGDQYVRNTLQQNLGNGQFSDVSLMANTFASDWSWSPLIFDMNNDGLNDLHITNGIFKRPNDLDYLNYLSNPPEGGQSQEERDEFLINTLPTVKIPNLARQHLGKMEMKDVANEWGLDQPSYSNGSAYADLDNDGDQELIVNNTEQAAFIYENKTDAEANFLTIALKGPEHNPFGIGAKVMLSNKNQKFFKQNYTTRGFQSSVPPLLYFGLGSLDQVDVRVIWPDGQQQNLTAVKINQRIEIDYSPEGGSMNLSFGSNEKLELVDHNISYRHKENSFNDFDIEYLIPRKFNTEGPALAVADVNGDGLEDVFFGGASDQAGELWIQTTNGSFKKQDNRSFEQIAKSEDVASIFFDANGDGAPDLYVTSAGNEFKDGQLFNYDKLYLNDGKGKLNFSPMSLPQIGSQGKTLSTGDIDGDGDLDVFVGSNIKAGNYGLAPRQYLLINNGRGQFKDEFNRRMDIEDELGMLNGSEMADMDADGDLDIVLAGEWTEVLWLENDGRGVFRNRTTLSGHGLWSSLHVEDINKDGLPDIIAGNLGLNSKLKASETEPLEMYIGDFDNNEQTDPILFHYQAGEQTPFASRDELIKQVSAFKKEHRDYKSYAKLSGPNELLGADNMSTSRVLKATELRSVVLVNQGEGKFEKLALPNSAQLSTVMSSVLTDIDGDQIEDLLLFGNNYSYRVNQGKSDAKPITLLSGKGDGRFTSTNDAYLNTTQTWGEYRNAQLIKIDGFMHVIAIRNDDSPLLLRLVENLRDID